MRLKKRKRSRRLFGSRTRGRAGKKARGKGNRGGRGNAGLGKRGGHKKTYMLKHLYPYFGKEGLKPGKKIDSINLFDITNKLGKYKKTSEGIEVNLPEYKILGEGEVKEKLIVRASGFSKKAKEKIEKAGGKAIVIREKKERKE